jgi:hypothetical protein
VLKQIKKKQTNNKENNAIEVVENDTTDVNKENVVYSPDLILHYNSLRSLMSKNYYWVYNVFNESEFNETRNDNFKDLALITTNNFEDFINKNDFKNIDEFKSFFNQFKAIKTYKTKFEKKHQIELTKIENIVEQIINY